MGALDLDAVKKRKLQETEDRARNNSSAVYNERRREAMREIIDRDLNEFWKKARDSRKTPSKIDVLVGNGIGLRTLIFRIAEAYPFFRSDGSMGVDYSIPPGILRESRLYQIGLYIANYDLCYVSASGEFYFPCQIQYHHGPYKFKFQNCKNHSPDIACVRVERKTAVNVMLDRYFRLSNIGLTLEPEEIDRYYEDDLAKFRKDLWDML